MKRGLAGPALAALAALTLLRLVLAARLPLAPDEAYYVLWSRHLQAGYFDHPPMVALWIRAGTALLGSTPLGIRLFGPLAGALGSVLIWRAGEDFWPRRQAGLVAAALLNATLMVGVGAIVMTPDTPLFFFWIAGIAALGRLTATGQPVWWLAVGAAAGAALLSKYTGLLFFAGIGVWLLVTPEGRASLRTVWPWAGAATALLIFLPNLLWNAEHDWVSLLKQGSRAAGFDPARVAQFLVELVVGQIALATPIICVLAVCGVWRLGRGHPLLWLALIPGLVFVEHVVSGRVQANWPSVLYPSACLAAAALPASRRWLAPALGLGFAITVCVYVQALAAPFPLAPRADPTALQFAGWGRLAADAQNAAAVQHAAFITSDEYATAAEFALRPGGVKILGYDRRWSYFGFPQAQPGAVGLMVTRRRDTACPDQLGTISRDRGGAVISTFKICRFVAPAGSVILPRPVNLIAPTAADVFAAQRRIAPHIVRTPMLRNAQLDRHTGGTILIKPEVLQRTGSFKLRGATNALRRLAETALPPGVVTFSSGNHGQAIACAAAALGLPATVVMPADAPAAKREATAFWGATIVTYDRLREDRAAIAARRAAETGAVIIPPYEHPDVIAGQGTLALELAADAAAVGLALDDMLVCTGGGGLIAGCALALAEVSLATRVYSVEPAGWDDTARSLAAGRRVANDMRGSMFCDALLTPIPGELTFSINQHLVTGGLVVSDEEVRAAMAFAARHLKLTVEPGGAVALAALLAGRIATAGRTIGALLSGGNL